MELFLQEKYIMQVMLNCPLTTNFQVAQGRDKHLLLILRDAQTNDTRYVKKVSEITSNRAIKELPRIFFYINLELKHVSLFEAPCWLAMKRFFINHCLQFSLAKPSHKTILTSLKSRIHICFF